MSLAIQKQKDAFSKEFFCINFPRISAGSNCISRYFSLIVIFFKFLHRKSDSQKSLNEDVPSKVQSIDKLVKVVVLSRNFVKVPTEISSNEAESSTSFLIVEFLWRASSIRDSFQNFVSKVTRRVLIVVSDRNSKKTDFSKFARARNANTFNFFIFLRSLVTFWKFTVCDGSLKITMKKLSMLPYKKKKIFQK